MEVRTGNMVSLELSVETVVVEEPTYKLVSVVVVISRAPSVNASVITVPPIGAEPQRTIEILGTVSNTRHCVTASIAQF